MMIRTAHEADARAMGHVMVASYMAAHRDQQPAEVWAKRAKKWTPEVSAQSWARTLRAITSGEQPQDCVYVAVDDGEIVGLAMGGQTNAADLLFPRVAQRASAKPVA
jgi:hypothetical protein